MQTIAAGADVSDIFSSGNIREIVNSYSCEKMCLHKLCSPGKNLRKLNNSLRFRALHGMILTVLISQKVPEVFVYFGQKCYDACIF